MGSLIRPILIKNESFNCPIQLQGSITKEILFADNTLICPIVLGFPEAPTLSEFDYEFDSPMA